MSGKRVFLEVDTSIRDKNLMITKSAEEEEEFSSFLKSTGIGQLPPIAVKPTPGFCVKAYTTDDRKTFLNFCQTEEIPAPKDISEEELNAVLEAAAAADEDSEAAVVGQEYCVPMSIGVVRDERDHRGDVASACDIAVNTAYMRKCLAIPTFQRFLIAVGAEGYQTKFGVALRPERVVLRNKRAMGTLQVHHIQQRKPSGGGGAQVSLLDTGGSTRGKIEVLEETAMRAPRFRLCRTRDADAGTLRAEFYMPYVATAADILVDVGEDRIVLESASGRYFVDVFHPLAVDRDATSCEYNLATKFLTVRMPIKV